MSKSAITAYLLHSDYMRDFYTASRVERAEFAKAKFREMFGGNKTYDVAAGWVVEATGEDAAEEAFDLSNNPSRDYERNLYWGKNRCLSTGDIVEVTNQVDGRKYFLCDSIGWVEFDPREA